MNTYSPLQILILQKNNKSAGFTLIELLVVVIIIGILAAIALPSMLSQAQKAKEAQAKSNIGAVNRAQQAYRLQNPIFAGDIADLDIGVDAETTHYTYAISENTSSLGEYKVTPKEADLKAFTGCAYADTSSFLANTNSRILDESSVGGAIAVPPECP